MNMLDLYKILGVFGSISIIFLVGYFKGKNSTLDKIRKETVNILMKNATILKDATNISFASASKFLLSKQKHKDRK